MVKQKKHDDFQGIQGLTDTHAHLIMLKKRGFDMHGYLTRLFAAGFGGIIDVGVDAGDLPGRLRAFESFENIRFSAGIWPSAGAVAGRVKAVSLLEQEIRKAPAGRVIALGECGLDRYRNKAGEAGIAGERELFELQLDLARRLHLPVIIHSRDAAAETLDILRRYPDVCGVIHCFSYGPAEARKFLDAGYCLSFAGNLTYRNAQDLRDALMCTPLDRMVFETDSPNLAPQRFRGETAHPAMVAETFQAACELLHIKPAVLAASCAAAGCPRRGFTCFLR
ncbi:MAG: TatD family hydrolase [Spirochaetaceae bacterium]|jgi:TatD DNase family protein|nr:TatD family hydrolase [Spirochaetaceae bacterium]